jgi:thiamine kinase
MSETLTATEALAGIPGWESASPQIAVLKGGLTNRTFHVRSGDKACVLRLAAEHSSSVLPDRSSELTILESAGRAGIAPGVLYADLDKGILLTEYLPGVVWQARDLDDPGAIDVLAGILRRVHALPLSGSKTDLNLFAATYVFTLAEHRNLHEFALRCADIVNSTPRRDAVACCHNDVVAGNIIGSPDTKMIDWEYAGDNDPLFDLASVIGYHDLDQQRAQHLLSAYAGGVDAELQESLVQQLRLYDAIQWLWLAARLQVTPDQKQAARLEELRRRIG